MTTFRYTVELSDGTRQVIIPALEVHSGSGALSTPRQIQSVTAGTGGTGQFVLSGDVTFPTAGSPSVGIRFQVGDTFEVSNPNQPQDPNIGTYTITAVVVSGSPNQTVLNVAEDVVNQLVGSPYAPLGQIRYATPDRGSPQVRTSLELSGRGSVNYGEHLNANLVHLLENFASPTAPNNPTLGQVWFNMTDEKFYEWTSTGWRSAKAEFEVMKEPTGYPDRTESTIAFDNGTRTFTLTGLTGSPGEFEYWIHGVKYTSPTITKVITDVEGMHYLYMNGSGVIEETTTFDPIVLLYDNAYTAAIYWDQTNQKAVYVGDERHGLTMDYATHIHMHLSFGTQFQEGLGLTDIVVNQDGSSDTHVQYGIEDGVIRDEDIRHQIIDDGGSPQVQYDLNQPLLFPAQLPIFYRDGAVGNWRSRDANTIPLLYDGDGVWGGGSPATLRPPYNPNLASPAGWALVEVPNEEYFLMHVVATNDFRNPMVAIVGENTYADKGDAQLGAKTELGNLTGLPFEEYTPVATIIYVVDSTYTNTAKAAFQSVNGPSGEEYIDWRATDTFAYLLGLDEATVKDHGKLVGLLDDDHPQYMKNLIEDVTPQLGGNLDVNSFDIIGTDNAAGGSPVTLADVNIIAGQNLVGTPGTVNITGGDGNTGYQPAGPVNIVGGAGVGQGYGGHVNITGGSGNSTGTEWAAGGNVVINGGSAAGQYGQGGEVQILSGSGAYNSGSPLSGGVTGADIIVTASQGINYSDGGNIAITSGRGGILGASAGILTIKGGVGYGSGNVGGHANFAGGSNASTGGVGGDVGVYGGGATGSGGVGGVGSLSGGAGGAQGGPVSIFAGQGQGVSSTAGDTTIKGGAAFGASSTAGKIILQAPFVSQVTGVENPVVEMKPAGAGGGNKRSPMQLRFLEHGANGSNYVGLVAPDSITGTVGSPLQGPVWALPQDNPTTADGKALTTDASGNMSFSYLPGYEQQVIGGSPLSSVTAQNISWTVEGSPLAEPANKASLQVFVDGAKRIPGIHYNVVSSTQLTFIGSPNLLSGNVLELYSFG